MRCVQLRHYRILFHATTFHGPSPSSGVFENQLHSMKSTILLFSLLLAGSAACAQDSMEKVMESRAREMFRVIGLDDKESWKKFITENYTRALIEKPMQAKRDTGGGSPSATTEKGTVEGKAKMYEMLHNDFASGKITALTVKGETAKMSVSSSNLAGTFTLKFSKEKPWLIDSIGIEVGN